MAFWDDSLCHFLLKFSSKLPKPHYSRLFSSTECSFIKTHFPLLEDNILIYTKFQDTKTFFSKLVLDVCASFTKNSLRLGRIFMTNAPSREQYSL